MSHDAGPTTKREPGKPRPQGEQAGPPGERSGRVLVVDDAEMVRDVLVEMLASLGRDAVAVGSGQEAVSYYREHGRDTDLVILDNVMPVMSGRECFRELKNLDPRVKVLVSTASPLNEACRRAYEGIAGCLSKPYGVDRLSDAIDRSLRQRGDFGENLDV